MQYATLREKISAEKAERKERYAKFERAVYDAHIAAAAAAERITPTPMVVRDVFTGKTDIAFNGACGQARVTVHPGNCSFARWAKKELGAEKAYGGGVTLYRVGQYGQSFEKKAEYARVFAMFLRDVLGVDVRSHSRLD